MEGLPVTIRLIDPPLHEFLPSPSDEIAALADRLGMNVDDVAERVHELQDMNSMLGFRGCRLSVIYPEIRKMQVSAIIS